MVVGVGGVGRVAVAGSGLVCDGRLSGRVEFGDAGQGERIGGLVAGCEALEEADRDGLDWA